MKRGCPLVLLALISVLISQPVLAFKVVKQFEETSYSLKDVSFTDEIVGWAVGELHWDQTAKAYVGTIIKTTDKGETWVAQETGVNQPLRGVCFVDPLNGWTVGVNGTILHTGDGGASWSQQAVGTTDEFRGVVFVDLSNGWATSMHISHYNYWEDPDNWEASIWHTSNGGQTWVKQTIPANASILNRIAFVDANKGWTVGVKYAGDDQYGSPQHNLAIYHTSDGGGTWQEQYTSDSEATLVGVDFIDSMNGWAVGFSGTVLRTSDGGATWIKQEAPGDGGDDNLWDVQFADLERGYAAGFNPYGPGPSLWRTLDGGATWESVYVRQNESELLYGLAVRTGSVLAVGTHDYIAISSDPWETFGPFGENSFRLRYSSFHYRFEDVFFVDESNGWAVGRRSFEPMLWGQVILNTHDGGVTWVTQYEHPPNFNDLFQYDYSVNSVFFTDTQTGWAVGGSEQWLVNNDYVYHGAILHTSDGGLHWEEQGSEIDDGQFFGVQFLDNQNGWALDSFYRVSSYPSDKFILSLAHTTDGGGHWEMVQTGIEGFLDTQFAMVVGGLKFIDDQHVWAVGGDGTVIHTEDDGKTWASQQLGNGDYWEPFAVEFIDEHVGWIAGGNGSYSFPESRLYRTTDSGSHWTAIEPVAGTHFHDIKFTDSLNGWLAGLNGVLMYTADGGDKWHSVDSGTSFDLWGISFINSQKGWAVGDVGTIISISVSSSLAVNFGPQGLWLYRNATWSLLTSATPNRMASYGNRLVANFPGYGLYEYDGTAWTQLTSNSSVENLVGVTDKLYADYGTLGLWKYDGTWTQLSPANPDKMQANGEKLLATFSGFGLYQYDGTTWTQLTSASTVDSMLGISGTVYADYGSLGLWKYDGTWTQITGSNPDKMQAYDGKLIANFPGYGLYEYNGTAWIHLTANDSMQDLIGVSSNLYADYGTLGLWKYNGTWTQLSAADPSRLGSYGDKLVANFPAYGLYEYDGSSWTMMTGNSGVTDMVSVDLP